MEPRVVSGDVDEDIVARGRVADPETLESTLDQGHAQAHGGDRTQITGRAARLRFEVEMRSRAMDTDPWDRPHIGE
jgi:hypothetical protein